MLPKQGGPVSPVDVLLAGDDQSFLEHAFRALQGDRRHAVVSCVEAEEASAADIALLEPELVVIDLAVPTHSAIRLMRRIADMRFRPRVLFLIPAEAQLLRAAALLLGVDAIHTREQFLAGPSALLGDLTAKRALRVVRV